jgi:hypothetical protein
MASSSARTDTAIHPDVEAEQHQQIAGLAKHHIPPVACDGPFSPTKEEFPGLTIMVCDPEALQWIYKRNGLVLRNRRNHRDKFLARCRAAGLPRCLSQSRPPWIPFRNSSGMSFCDPKRSSFRTSDWPIFSPEQATLSYRNSVSENSEHHEAG